MSEFKIGDEVWFVCIDGEIWILAKGTILEFPVGNQFDYPEAIIKTHKMKTEFHTSSYFKTKPEALAFMETYMLFINICYS